MHSKRVVTALVLAVVFLIALFAPIPRFFSAFLTLLLALASLEWNMLVRPSKKLYGVLFSGGNVALFVSSVLLLSSFAELTLWVALIQVAAWFLLTWVVANYPRPVFVVSQPLMLFFIGALLLLGTTLSLNWLSAQHSGSSLVLLLVSSIAAADIGAYYSGKRWGSRLLAPQVSPGKTIEGLLGGIALNVCFTTVYLLILEPRLQLFSHPLHVYLVCLSAGLASVIGDLFESVLKRSVGVKDSGQWLPGHGGILDRIDGILAAAPVFVLLFYVLERGLL